MQLCDFLSENLTWLSFWGVGRVEVKIYITNFGHFSAMHTFTLKVEVDLGCPPIFA